MTKALTDKEIIEKSGYSLDYLNKLKAENPDMFTSKRFRDLRKKIILSRQKQYYAVNTTTDNTKKTKLRSLLPRQKERSLNAVPAIITENCGTSRVKLNAFRRANPDLFTPDEWNHIKCQLRKQQGTINSARYRIRKAIAQQTDNRQPLIMRLPVIEQIDINNMPTVSNEPDLSKQSSITDDLDWLMPDYASMSLTDTDFNIIDSVDNLFWSPASP